MPLPWGYIYVLNHEKKMYKIRLQRDFFETCNKWVKWLCLSIDIQILSPGGCLPLPRDYIHVLNHKTNCVKSDFKGIFLKLASNEWNDKTFLLTLKLCPLGAVCPCPGAIYMYKIMKKVHKIRLQRDFFKTCNKWPKCQDVPVDIKISSPRGCQPLPRGYMYIHV